MEKTSEFVGVKLRVDLHLFFIFKHPRMTLSAENINRIASKLKKVIIGEDFNMKHLEWLNPTTNVIGRILHDCIVKRNIVLEFPD